jgi:predicted glutamine amidotransferase
MCIAILNTEKTLSLKTFKNCWNANPDGAGLTYFDGQQIQILKEMKSVKQFHADYLEIRKKHPSIDIAIHFRIATHGKINTTNCHPFKINKKSAFIHNGMISAIEKSAEFSDTYLFNEIILKNLPANFTTNSATIDLISHFIGYSKLVIISGKDSLIINEHLGHWNGGDWYSNDSYKDKIQYTSVKYTKKSATNWDRWTPADYYGDTYYTPTTKTDKRTKTTITDDSESNICDCCTEHAPSHYNYEYNIFMCDKCINTFKDY